MESKVFVHIGMHKTGTTYLQQYYFPALGNVNVITEKIRIGKLGRDYGNGKHFLISSEGLSGSPWNNISKVGNNNCFNWMESFKEAITNLNVLFPHAHIIIVFRKHGELLLSLYKQYVQSGGMLKISEFYSSNGIIKPSDLSIMERIYLLKSIFNNVDFISYDDFKNEGSLLFDKYFMQFGIERNREVKVSKNSNKSINGIKVDILRTVNKGYYYFPESSKKLLSHLRLSPRAIMQYGLRLWKTKDSDKIQRIVSEINTENLEDWNSFINIKWSLDKTSISNVSV